MATRRIVVIAAGIIALIAAAALKLSSGTHDPVRLLVTAQKEASREIEPRLSGGFEWAPLTKATRTGSAGRAALLEAAAEISRGERDTPIHHATALARILTGNAHLAVTILEPLATSADAGACNDLAAAQYLIAVRDGDPSRLQCALVAVDSALRIDPMYPEARFNRALIIQAFGLRDLAREEWETYLRVDPSSGWSTEARSHLRSLAAEEEFDVVVKRDYDKLATDPSAAHAFARRYPQRTRTWGEAELLGNWAAATHERNAAAAAKHLGLARELGAELARNGGDHTVLALVHAVDDADPARRTALAKAHLHFRDGLRAYRDRRPKDAYPLLISAAEEFARGRSPGQTRTAYFIAGTLFLQGNIAECGRRMQQLLASVPPGFFGHRAEVRWVLASVAVSEGRWEDCIEAWTESLSIYERLGETNNAAIIRQQLVFTYDRLGNRSRAWKQRMLALRELGRQLSTRQQEAIGSLTRAAMMDEDWPTALSFARLEVDVARHLDRPTMHIESLLYRAEIHSRLGERASAAADLAEARRRSVEVTDTSFRAGMEIRTSVVEALLTTNPAAAVRLLTTAIEFHSSKGRRMYLPDLYLRRGRALLQARDDAHAGADFEAGVAELERQRETVLRGEDRWGVFRAAQELFAEGIALALSRNDVQTAFDYSERARARALFDTLGSQWRPVRAADIPAHTSVIEYAVHGDTMFIFVLDDRGVRALRRTVNHTSLAAEITAFLKAGAASDAARFDKTGRALYTQLIVPIEQELAGRKTLVIVPDPTLGLIPFAALIDGTGRYLVETYAVTTEPSVAFFATARTQRAGVTDDQVLVVTGDAELGRLAAAEREAKAIAALHKRSTLLERDRATAERFFQESRNATLVHFAGHSVASTATGDGYLSLVPGGSGDGRLDLKEISSAAFPRTSLVVLAACDTAAGDVRSGEGTISVARSFLAAGVPSVIATLWPIEDEASSQFFPALHRYVVRGMPAKDALRATQIDWIRKGDRSIGLWAAVQLVGQ